MSQTTITGTNIFIGNEEIFSLPVASILIWLSDTAPTNNYLHCDGTSFDPTKYPDLYRTIGESYGGSSTAPLLPNLKDRTPIGAEYHINTGVINSLVGLSPGPPSYDSTTKTGGNFTLFPNQLLHTHLVTGSRHHISKLHYTNNTDYDTHHQNFYTMTNHGTGRFNYDATLSTHSPPHSKVNYIIFAGYNHIDTGSSINNI